MNSNKKKQNKKEGTNVFVKIGRLLFICLFAYVVYDVGKGTHLNYSLRKKGICTKAIVSNREKGHRGKGDVVTKYNFVWKGNTYTGVSYYDTKTEGKTWLNDKYIIGDTITIVFLESNPKINKSNNVVKKKCDCQ